MSLSPHGALFFKGEKSLGYNAGVISVKFPKCPQDCFLGILKCSGGGLGNLGGGGGLVAAFDGGGVALSFLVGGSCLILTSLSSEVKSIIMGACFLFDVLVLLLISDKK